MSKMFTLSTKVAIVMVFGALSFSLNGQEYRTISGVNNNLQHPEWGAAGANLLRTTTNGYADGAYLPAGALQRGGRRAKATGDYEAWTPDA